MKDIYGMTHQDLETYFLELGEKNLKQHKFMNGYMIKESIHLMRCLM